jgi:hypothetical protein
MYSVILIDVFFAAELAYILIMHVVVLYFCLPAEEHEVIVRQTQSKSLVVLVASKLH